MKKLLFVTLIATLISCSKNDEISSSFLSCDQIGENFKDYNGEELECQFYYTLSEYNGQNYIELNSHCADLTRPYVYNENCIDICENDPYNENSECGKYLKVREMIEIILIEK